VIDITQKTIEIGGLRFRIRSQTPATWPSTDRRYANYFVPDAQDPHETITFRVIEDRPRPPGAEAETVVTFNDGHLKLEHGPSIADWDRERNSSVVYQQLDSFDPRYPYPEACLDSLVRVILSFKLLARDGFLIHASGLARNGNGYLFAGESGAGKSTVALASAQTSTILSDDLVLAYLTQTGGEIWGTPFFGTVSEPGPNVSAPLKGIYFLRKAPANELVRLTDGEALPRLLKTLMYFGDDRETAQCVLDLALAVCRRVPMYDLHFLPDCSFWGLLDD
jgi:hypothetical protein